MKAAADRS